MDVGWILVSLCAAIAACGAVVKLLGVLRKLDRELQTPLQLRLEDPDDIRPVPLPSVFSNASKSLSVVIPAYNEEARLPDTLQETISYLEQRRNREGPKFTSEIIVVDDGSRDNTARVTQDYVKKYGFDSIRLLRLPKNRGKGCAVQQGMLIARGSLCLFMDADGATRVADMEKLEGELKKCQTTSLLCKNPNAPNAKPSDALGPVAMVVGSRAHLEQVALAKRSRLRNFLMHGFHMLVMFVAGNQVKDTQCGFKMMTRRAAAVLYSNQRLQRWCFDVELIYLAHQLGIPVREVHVNWTEMPGSKIRFTSILHMAFELLVVKVAYQWLHCWNIVSEGELIQKKQ